MKRSEDHQIACSHGRIPLSNVCQGCLEHTRIRAVRLQTQPSRCGLTQKKMRQVREQASNARDLAGKIYRQVLLITPETGGPLTHKGPGRLGEALLPRSLTPAEGLRSRLTHSNLFPEPKAMQMTKGHGSFLRGAPASKVFVWGYGAIRAATPLDQFVETEEARQFAAERGWSDGGPGAWAKECSFALALCAALARLEGAMRSDPAIAGWGGRTAGAEECGRYADDGADSLASRVSRAVTAARAHGRHLAMLRAETTQLRHQLAAIMAARTEPSLRLSHLPPLETGALSANEPSGRSEQRFAGSEPDLPAELFELLNTTISDALRLAAYGRLADAYSHLLRSLHAAEEDTEQGVAWASELERVYRLAIDNYVSRYGVSME
jgi:hypothetical protein